MKSSGFDRTKLSGIVSRNQSDPLFIENSDEPRLPRTRVSARFDRGRWLPENERELFDMPHRSEGKTMDRTATSPLPLCKPRKTPTRKGYRPFTEAEVLAKPKHGLYTFAGFVKRADHDGQLIRARCSGTNCNSRQSYFSFAAWMQEKDRMSCHRCASMSRRIEERERKLRETHPSRGRYEVLRVNPFPGKGLCVVAKCTGPECGGHERLFSWATWQALSDETLGCIKCSAPERTKNAGDQAHFKSLAKLDAAAAEMRKRDEEAA